MGMYFRATPAPSSSGRSMSAVNAEVPGTHASDWQPALRGRVGLLFEDDYKGKSRPSFDLWRISPAHRARGESREIEGLARPSPYFASMPPECRLRFRGMGPWDLRPRYARAAARGRRDWEAVGRIFSVAFRLLSVLAPVIRGNHQREVTHLALTYAPPRVISTAPGPKSRSPFRPASGPVPVLPGTRCPRRKNSREPPRRHFRLSHLPLTPV